MLCSLCNGKQLVATYVYGCCGLTVKARYACQYCGSGVQDDSASNEVSWHVCAESKEVPSGGKH